MSYQVIARKYRPQKFQDVIGQEHVTRTLINALAMGRIHHAYLFAGARGIGKTTVARLLAKALNCENLKDGEPCNTCRPCMEITNSSSLDVQEIDGASNTGVDDVREIRDKARYLPSSGKYKIYIIDEVHMLSTSAFNALLKTLEEPPPHVVFIFATTESHKIPATILSRCQRYDFRRIPSPMIAQTLKLIAKSEGVDADDEALAIIAREAGGSMRDGQSLFDQSIAFAGSKVTAETLKQLLGFLDRTTIMNLTSTMLARDSAKALAQLDEIYQTGSDLTQLANSVLETFKNLLVIKVSGSLEAATDLSPGEGERLKKLTETLSAEDLERMFQIWYGGAEQIARSPFPKMLAEVLVIRICNSTPVTPLADIIARIDGLAGEGGRPTFGAQACHPESNEVSRLTNTPKRDSSVASLPQNDKNPKTASPENRWPAFMEWVANERPQVASVFNHGRLKGFDGTTLEFEFDAPLYAEMVSEPDRRKQIDALLEKFFGRKFAISVTTSSAPAKTAAAIAAQKQKITKEALENPLVKQAAEIFDARIHEVKTKE